MFFSPSVEFEDKLVDRLDLDAAISRLSRQKQRIFWLYHRCGYTVAEIAESENCTAQNIDLHLASIKKLLPAT